ncbi:MAG TPA: hypothetical protein PLV68_19750, partial [Ilumatobacteraceae bacterium]|nr:hypothetical protein [Ilumatobacteraceae bacterium]
FAWGAMPVGAAVGGLIARATNQRVPYLAAAACVVVGVVIMLGTVTTRTLAEAGGKNR